MSDFEEFDNETAGEAIRPADPITPAEIVAPDILKSSDPGEFLQVKMGKALLAVQTDRTFIEIIGQAAQLEMESRRAEGFVIQLPEEEKGFIELLGRIEKTEKLAEMRRQEMTIFPWRVFQAINRLYKGDSKSPGVIWGLGKARERVEKVVSTWRGRQAKERQVAEETKKAIEESMRKAQAELQVRHEEAVLRRELTGEMGPTFTPPPVQVILPPPPLPDLPAVENVVRAEDGTTAYMRKGPIDFIAFDKKLLCAAIAEGKMPVDCVEVVKGELRKFVRGEQREKREAVIPGVEIIEKDKLVVQTGGR